MQHTEQLRIQPHDEEAEQGILGAILLDRSALARAQELLSGSEFYSRKHRVIFETMVELIAGGDALDLVTLGDRLKGKGELTTIGGHEALAEILTAVASSSNIAQHCQIVRDHATRRGSIKNSFEIIRRAYDNDSVEDLLRDSAQMLMDLTFGRDGRTWYSMETTTRETLDYVDSASKGSVSTTPLSTGTKAVDDFLAGGWRRSDLNIVAARPSMGKTSFVLGSAVAAAKQGAKVGVISLEMSRLQLGIRLVSMEAPLNVHALRSGALKSDGWWLLANTAQALSPLSLWVDDSSVLTVEQIQAKARQLRLKHGLDLLIVDYLQLLQFSGAETRQQGIADASRALKLLAKELDIAVVVLSQLSRDCDKREDKRPILSDLRDSGAIEQDADVVLFLYRHEVYVHDTEEKGVAEVHIRKHRNGPIGDCQLKFVAGFARFEDFNS